MTLAHEAINLNPMTQDLSPVELPHPTQAIAISDKSNPLSVINLVPAVVAQAIDDALFTNPELFDLDEHRLAQKLRKDAAPPTPADHRVRMKFWNEYDRAMARGETKLVMVNVLAGVCTQDMFYKFYLKQPQKVAWLMCPPTGYMIKAEEALEFGMGQLRDVLEQPHVINGKVDTRLANLKAKIVQMLEARVLGAVVQKTMNLNVSSKQVDTATAEDTMESLQRQLKELDRRNRQAQNIPLPPGEREVTSEVEVDPT